MTDINDLLPVLSIRRRAGSEGPAIVIRDSEICLDGLPLKGVQSLKLSMSGDDVNRLAIDFAVRDVEVDEDVLVALQAHVKERAPA